VHDDKLRLAAQRTLDERKKFASHDIGPPAGRKANDDFDGLVIRPRGPRRPAGSEAESGNERDDLLVHDFQPCFCYWPIAPPNVRSTVGSSSRRLDRL